MIVNEYNNSFSEIKETDRTFLSTKSPQLFVSDFDFKIKKGDTLIIPYRIHEYHDEEDNRIKKNNDPRGDKGTFIDKLGNKYTTIVVLDEDKEEPENGFVTYKQTTYGGQQVIEIGPCSVGEHCFSIRAIEDTGISTARHLFYFLVENPQKASSIKRLEDILTDQGNGVKTFTSEYKYDPTWKDEYGNFTNGSARYTRTSDDSPRAAKSVIVAKYEVSTKWTSDNKLKSFTVTIRNNQDAEPNNVEKYSDTGFVYKNPTNNFLKIEHNKDDGSLLTYSKIKENIAGVYEFNTTCIVNGQEKQLSDYLKTTFVELPIEVQTAAVKNKIALTRLFEAFQAYHNGQQCTLIMPKNTDIIIDYHKLNAEGKANIARQTWNPNENRTEIPGPVAGGDEIKFPNNFTLDLNGSSISILQCYDCDWAGIISFNLNYNSCVKNGKIQGLFHYYNYDEKQKVKYKKNDGTWVSVGIEGTYCTAFWGSKFCTFENMDLSGAVGYDCYFGESKTHGVQKTGQRKYCPPFDAEAYIDYDGVMHLTSRTQPERYYDVDISRNYSGIPSGLKPGTQITYAQSNNNRYFVLAHTLGKSGYDDLRNRMQIHMADECIRGSQFIPTTAGAGGGFNHRHICRELFVHFFSGPVLPQGSASANYKFLCTHKIMEEFPAIIPKEATHAAMSAWGFQAGTGRSCNNLNSKLGQTGSEYLLGAVHPAITNNSVCCAYIDCKIHDNRTSLFDNNHCAQSLVKDCITWNGGSGRFVNNGGWSNQTMYVDVEDAANFNCEGYFVRLENLYGAAGFKIHFSKNLVFKDTAGFNIGNHKGTYGTFVDGHTGNITEYHGFAAPIKYTIIQNSYIPELDNTWEHTRGDASKDLNVRDSVIGILRDEDNVFLKNCKRETVQNI